MLKDPQFVARESIVDGAHPVFGTVKMQNAFPKLSDTPGGCAGRADLGEHTDAVLTEVTGMSAEALAGLRSRNVI
jgi:formyl-CoA transferase